MIFLSLLSGAGQAVAAEAESLSFGRFGDVALYRNSTHPAHVVLFVSGDGGWNLGVIDMAKAIATDDTLVVGIDITHYLRELERSHDDCQYPAADFELLSKFLQKSLAFPLYKPPVLIGYSSGATLVYAILAQSPPDTFLGAISLGFCPDLNLTKPLCHGAGLTWKPGPEAKGYSFLPAKNLQNPWIALQGSIDQVCNPTSIEAFVKQVPTGELVILPKVGHGFSVRRNWMPQFKEAFRRLVKMPKTFRSPDAAGLKALPLVEVPGKEPLADVFAVIISGDGGWVGIDRDVASILAANGISVVGLNSLRYFWKRRTPEGAAQDLETIINYYMGMWKKKRIILIGYSLGAEVLPFMANRLPDGLLGQVSLIALIGPGQKADFEFRLKDWVGAAAGSESRPVYPEVEKLRGKRIFCFCGKNEPETLCRKLDAALARVVVLKGGHHFGGNYGPIVETILRESRGPFRR